MGACHVLKTVPCALLLPYCRKSQEKFKSSEQQEGWQILGLVAWSKPFVYGHLNTQIVSLLSALGIPDDVLLLKQQEYLQQVSYLIFCSTACVAGILKQ